MYYEDVSKCIARKLGSVLKSKEANWSLMYIFAQSVGSD